MEDFLDPLLLTTQQSIDILAHGEIELKGQFVWGSNYTFLVYVQQHELPLQAVYKPVKGERELWDFPPETLAQREFGAFLVSEALGWHFVPATIIREDGPYGAGMLQLFIPHDPEKTYFSLTDDEKQRLKATAIFDIILNNADRKGSHLLYDRTGKLWVIDHGICFHQEPKLRTVIWDFIGEPIPENILADVRNLGKAVRKKGELREKLQDLLLPGELSALSARIEGIVSHPIFPQPAENFRPFPYPLV